MFFCAKLLFYCTQLRFVQLPNKAYDDAAAQVQMSIKTESESLSGRNVAWTYAVIFQIWVPGYTLWQPYFVQPDS